MRKHLFATSTLIAIVIGVLTPVQTLAGPTALPGKTQGNGPCVTSGNTNSQIQSTKNSNKACVPAAVPSAPTNLTATVIDSTSVSLAFTPGANNGSAITSYTVTTSPTILISYSGTSSPITITGSFFEGQAYTFTMTATNAVGTSSSSTSSNSITPYPVTAPLYNIGDTGPGGGKIFYYSATGFNCGSTFSAIGSPSGGKCHYLEVAPSTWFDNVSDPLFPWAIGSFVNTSVQGATETAIGGGFKNSSVIVPTIGGPYESYAAGIARGYRNTTGEEWYLPSKDELNQMCKWARGQAWVSDVTQCDTTGTINSGINAEGFQSAYYWSSTENVADEAWAQSFVAGTTAVGKKYPILPVRPIRAF